MRPISLRHGLHQEERHHECKPELTKDQVEHLASRIVEKGSDAILKKEGERFAAAGLEVEEMVDISAADNVDSTAVANKMIKEAAREMAREEGKHNHQVFHGSDASWAARVKAKKDDKQSIEHQVAARVQAKLHVAQDREGGGHHMFTGIGAMAPGTEHGRA